MADVRIPARRPRPPVDRRVVADRRVANDTTPVLTPVAPPIALDPAHAPLQHSRAQAASDRVASGSALHPASDSALPLEGRHFLIVTAPFGPFGRVLAAELEARGARVRRMIFNIGDLVYWRRPGGLTFDGDVRDWPARLAGLVTAHGLTDLVVFGEGGPYNQAVLTQADALKALAVDASSDSSPAQAARLREPGVGGAATQERAQAASARGASGSALRIWVLENGYFRPDWITVEQDGVNARSGLARARAAYDPPIPEIVPARPVGRALPHHVANISLYHFLQFLVRPFAFRRYAQPYTTPAWLQCASHIRRYFGLMLRSSQEADAGVIRARGPFFIACLQREGDAQLLRYSHYADNTAFLAEVLTSFAKHAPDGTRLVVKNHPLDPGLVDLRRMTRVLAIERGIADRVDFIDGGNLAQLCRASAGMVVNNSSAALSALGFKTPVKVLGEAFFDFDGLTDQQTIDAFWTRPRTPDPDLFVRFRAHVIDQTQVNGNYHEPKALKPTAKAVATRFETAG
ncbi:capsule biosynthesis protein [Brevundimonas subvibrioides]|uniref:Capsule polysaccharide biosynthesis protein n=1 Tax=Brevundimonas subvibrioides (strain ATCC 15264 / DSM 4735 / LMG 14903 / NBRC 16000 / CB 81) TaxID=633149 RepID=D9QG26_BRESC|nr:capsular biosynthesis protein [Brevundimonas subvibrioides]ADL02568.1 Capsule polysaccharide biosynthesis protein [Brevundimonas subvibrioides ATCC 15264]